MSQSTIEVSVCKIRIQLDRLIIVDNCSPVIFQHGRNISTIIICIYKVRSQIYHLIQIFSHHLIIYCGNLFTLIIARNNICFDSLFSLLIFQLFTTNQCTHKICREEITIQQDCLSQIRDCTREVLHQIKINCTGKTF